MNRRFPHLCFIYAILLLATAAITESHAADVGIFKGLLVANGTRSSFPFGDKRQVFTFKLAGHVNLQNLIGKKKEYSAECIGLSDSVTGVNGRCVWKDPAGAEIYITLLSDSMQQGSKVYGTIVGGTGNLAGISGDFSFNWSSINTQEESGGVVTLSGQTKNLSGSYRVP